MGQYADLSVDQIQKAGNIGKEQKAAGNVAASREVQSSINTATQPSMVQTFFEGESQRRKQNYALDDARTQTGQMKDVMAMQKTNFDNAYRNERRLDAISSGSSKALLAAEKQFKSDSMGRKILSERQLADWYATKAATEEDWANYQATSEQMHERRLMILTASYNKMIQAEKQAYAAGAAALDRDTQTAIAQAKAELTRKIQAQKNKGANSSALISGLSTVGTVVGSYWGPMGAMAGGAGGAGAGKLITDSTEG
jgi:hypothetical protein